MPNSRFDLVHSETPWGMCKNTLTNAWHSFFLRDDFACNNMLWIAWRCDW